MVHMSNCSHVDVRFLTGKYLLGVRLTGNSEHMEAVRGLGSCLLQLGSEGR